MRAWFIALLTGLVVWSCTPTEEPAEVEATEETEAEEAEAPAEEAAEAPAEEAAAAEPAEPAADTFEGGVYTSPKFNVRFTLPEGWRPAAEGDGTGPGGLGQSDDSLTFVGPADTGLRLVLANTESIQLVDSSFGSLTETVAFEQVRIDPDNSTSRTCNGVPCYRTEADAMLRGDPVPQYIIAQALELPGKPAMFTVFVPGDRYDLHSDDMKSILDSVEVIDLRGGN